MKIDNVGAVLPVKAPVENVPQVVQAAQAAPQPQPVRLELPSGDKTKEQEETITPEMMDKAVQQANKTLANFGTAIERTVHEKTHAIIYVLKDAVTNEVIREFPPKKIQDMIAKMWELAGLFVDEKG